MSPAKERELISQAATGSHEALAALVDEHEATVFRYAMALVHRREDAEEVLQDVFVALMRYARGFRGEASLRTWLLTVTRNSAFRRRKKAAMRAEESIDLDALGRAAGWGSEDPESLAIRAERREELERALAGLGDEDREMILLRDLEGLSGRETAQMLGISVAAMKSRLHRARLRLAAELRAGGVR